MDGNGELYQFLVPAERRDCSKKFPCLNYMKAMKGLKYMKNWFWKANPSCASSPSFSSCPGFLDTRQKRKPKPNLELKLLLVHDSPQHGGAELRCQTIVSPISKRRIVRGDG